jgi:hypothetical protein
LWLAVAASALAGTLSPIGAASSSGSRLPSPPNDSISARQAVFLATTGAKGWAPDATLFAVVGAERSHDFAVPPPSRPPPAAKPNPPDRFPCGRIDAAVWQRFFDPAWGGEPDGAVGDGRTRAWQVVFFSRRRNRGASFLVRSGHRVVCAADPLTARDRQQLRGVRARGWTTDSTDAIAAVRASSAAVARALTRSRRAQVFYAVDFRTAGAWGIKGRVEDAGITFSASVAMSSLRVTNLSVQR